MRVFIKTYGCKVNYADSVELAHKLVKASIECDLLERSELPQKSPGESAVFAVNTCAVTAEAVAKARRFCRRLKRLYPRALIVATGCAARAADIAREFSSVGATVVPWTDRIVSMLAQDEKSRKGRAQVEPTLVPFAGRARYFLKVQDGCNAGCSYCIIPRVRRRQSKAWHDVRAELATALARGVPEVVLTGINLGLYRAPDSGWGLTELMQNMLELVPERSRLRLSSVEPEHVNERLLGLFAHPRMCPHLHLPLQSGSDAVLSAMRRQYTAGEYMELVRDFRQRHPWGAVTTDVMVGYPAESQADFEKTSAMVRECGFERLHIFRFSPRPGTAAEGLRSLPSQEVRAREHELFAAAREVAAQSLGRYLGHRCEVALETRAGVVREGYGEAYQRVRLTSAQNVPKGLALVELRELKDGVFVAAVESE